MRTVERPARSVVRGFEFCPAGRASHLDGHRRLRCASRWVAGCAPLDFGQGPGSKTANGVPPSGATTSARNCDVGTILRLTGRHPRDDDRVKLHRRVRPGTAPGRLPTARRQQRPAHAAHALPHTHGSLVQELGFPRRGGGAEWAAGDLAGAVRGQRGVGRKRGSS
jgi:hypothetical protein